MFWARLPTPFRRMAPLEVKSLIVSNQTVEEGEGIKTLDLHEKIYLCLKSFSLFENRHGKEDGFRLQVLMIS